MNNKSIFMLSKMLLLSLAVIVPAFTSCAGDGKDFKKLPSGLQYKIVVDKKQTKGKVGDIIKLNLTYSTAKDSVIFSSYQAGGQPVEFPIGLPQFKGDAMEGFTLLGSGDSAIFLMSVDSVYKNQPMPNFCKSGEFIKLAVNVVSVLPKEEYEKQQNEAAMKQNETDAKIIEDYIAKNNLKALKTADGLYYIVEKQGDGPKAEAGKKVKVNYTGKLLDGKIFDSSLNPGREPFEFDLGAGQVIRGWDEGIALFNVGGKGTLLIPSSMGYGSRGAGANIPPNSVLIFDIEVLGVQ